MTLEGTKIRVMGARSVSSVPWKNAVSLLFHICFIFCLKMRVLSPSEIINKNSVLNLKDGRIHVGEVRQ